MIMIMMLMIMMIMMLTTPSRIVHTADALRLLVIARYGGFYSDTDVVFIRFFHRNHADDDDDDDDDCADDDADGGDDDVFNNPSH